MKKIIFKNERAMASAGSGKTFELTSRLIALILGGAKPEEICALTFTRKAAGELFEKPLEMLAKAAESEKSARELAGYIQKIAPDMKPATRADFENALEKFAKAAPRLRFETIDAFTSSFVKFFAAELGVNDSITILDDFAEAKIKTRAMMLAVKELGSSKTFAEFAQVVKDASNGKNEKRIFSALEKLRKDAHAAFLETPEESKWKCPAPSKKIPQTEWNAEKYAANNEILRALADNLGDESERKAKQGILKFLCDSSFEKVADPKANAAKAAIAQFAQKATVKGAEFSFNRKNYSLSDAEAKPIDENFAMLFWAHVRSAQAAAEAVYKIISKYDEIYDAVARKNGLMSFADMTVSIAKAKDEIAKELVEFRFDSAISHWLFDEFQDTSRLQWRIFENMISEAVLNSDGEKTFFYVGDAKQAIYAWRGGDVSLFNEILEKFSDHIVDKPQKKTSWRSCPAVIDAVNKIFSDAAQIESHYGKAPAQKWAKIWEDHDVAEINIGKKGEVAAQIVDEGEKSVADAVYEYIKDTKIFGRKLTCAVLVQENKLAAEIIDTIRARAESDNLDIRAAGELDIKIAQDNIAIPPIFAMLKAAAHPGDGLSLAFAKMSPLKEIFASENWRKNLILKISSLGFARALQTPAKILADASPDKFTSNRISQFLEAARIFDDAQTRDIDDFLDFISAYKIREGAASDTIQVMTIHKAKGLDFDLVILPQLEEPKGNRNSGELRSRKGEGVLFLPAKPICCMDENLAQAHSYSADENNFEKLCKFYVAMTRAKRAIRIILPSIKAEKTKEKTQSKMEGKHNFAYLLRCVFPIEEKGGALSECSALNDPEWIEDFPLKDAAESAEAPRGAKIFSGEESALPWAFEFDFLNRRQANLTGLAAHSIFENLSPETTPDDAANKARSLYCDCPEIFEEALAEVKKSLENPQIKELFACPDFAAELPYAIEENGEAITGRIDRVNFFEGRSKAEIIDFKTDAATPEELIARHSAQLERYAAALSKITGIARENIALKILSTHNRSIVEVKA